MHTNYYFLRQLSQQLAQKLTGWQIGTCFSQQKDELVIGFYSPEDEFYINAILRSDFCCLHFPDGFARSKRNNIDLFPQLLDLRITRVKQYENERAFAFELEDDYLLLFKMHGLRSNILLFKQGQLTDLFRKRLKGDESLDPTTLDRPIKRDYEAFVATGGKWQPLYPTFGKEVKNHLLEQGWESMDLKARWDLLQATAALLDEPVYYLKDSPPAPSFTLLPGEGQKKLPADPIAAINQFFRSHIGAFSLHQERALLLRQLDRQIKQSESYIDKNLSKLDELTNTRHYEEWANILMANLHQVNTGQEEATLFDFYHDRDITIPLKSTLSPQKNAEVFYRKAKNQKLEVNQLEENITNKEEQLGKLKAQRDALNEIEQVKELRTFARDEGLQNAPKQEQKTEPFMRFEAQGFDIWVGRNAKANDELTLKHSFKEDLWLHAKDVSGSHVLIKYKAGKTVPPAVKEHAAALAAWYSKRKNDTLCPVICTPKKFVRKPKGLPPGAVIVDKELEVILIEPQAPADLP